MLVTFLILFVLAPDWFNGRLGPFVFLFIAGVIIALFVAAGAGVDNHAHARNVHGGLALAGLVSWCHVFR